MSFTKTTNEPVDPDHESSRTARVVDPFIDDDTGDVSAHEHAELQHVLLGKETRSRSERRLG